MLFGGTRRIHEHFEKRQMLRLFDESFGVPLNRGEEGKSGVLETLDDAIGGFGDDAQPAAETIGGLLVITVDGNIWLADGATDLGIGIDHSIVARNVIADFAMFLGIGARYVWDELVHAPAAVDVHELRAHADAERGHAAFFDLGEESEFEFLAGGIDGDGLGMPGLAVESGIEIVSAGEEDSVKEIDELGDEGKIGLVWDQERQTAGALDGLGIGKRGFVFVGIVVGVEGDADFGARHGG